VVEGARLERVYAGNRIEGSNPSPSAKKADYYTHKYLILWNLFHFPGQYPSFCQGLVTFLIGPGFAEPEFCR
jgi:hypothetical protein